MKRNLTVVEWMTAKDLITAGPNMSVRRAFYLIKKHRIHFLPVTVQGKVIGIVTDRDLRLPITKLNNIDGVYRINDDIKVYQIMTREILSLSPNDSIETAARLVTKYAYGGFPVLNNKNEKKLLGVLTTADIMKAMVYMMDELRL